MKNIGLLSLSVLVTACFGCSGGGGSGGGSSTDSGSAIFQNFTAMGTNNNVCLNYSQPEDETTCNAMSGTWNTSRSIVTTTAGSYDESTYAMSCASGTASAKCRVNGVDFSDKSGLSVSSVDACLSNGGEVHVVCTDTDSEMVGNCTGVVPSDSTDCSSLGGTFYSALHHATGSITEAGIIAGTNLIQTLIDPAVDDVDVMSLNPQAPVYLTFKILLKAYEGTTFWESSQSKNTSAEFVSSGDYETFTITSPVATSVTDNGSIVVEDATLHFE